MRLADRIARVFDPVGPPIARSGVPAQTTSDPRSAPIPVPWVSGSTALALSAMWRGIHLIADTIADMPWLEWDGPENAPIPVPPSRLVRRPYELMTRREWTWRVVATEALHSTAYLLYVGGYDEFGSPWSLLPVPPDAISPLSPPDPWGLTQPTQYWVGGGRVSADDLTIIRRSPFPGMTDQLAGLIDIARRQLSAYLAADTHLQRYWSSGGPTVTQITSDQELTPDDAEVIAQRWVDRRTLGADYPAVFGKGAKAEPWGADPTTESAVEARKEMVADVGRYLGIPTHKLNAPAGDSETYTNVENDAIDLYRDTLRGYAGPIEDAISELLPGDYVDGRRMRIDPTRYLQGDLVSRAQSYPALIASGVLTVDEVRAAGFGLGPRDGSPIPEITAEALPAAMVTIGG